MNLTGLKQNTNYDIKLPIIVNAILVIHSFWLTVPCYHYHFIFLIYQLVSPTDWSSHNKALVDLRSPGLGRGFGLLEAQWGADQAQVCLLRARRGALPRCPWGPELVKVGRWCQAGFSWVSWVLVQFGGLDGWWWGISWLIWWFGWLRMVRGWLDLGLTLQWWWWTKGTKMIQGIRWLETIMWLKPHDFWWHHIYQNGFVGWTF